MKITYVPHALDQMKERNIFEEQARAPLEEPEVEYPGSAGCMVEERTFAGRRLAIKVVHNLGMDDERVVFPLCAAGRRGGEPVRFRGSIRSPGHLYSHP